MQLKSTTPLTAPHRQVSQERSGPILSIDAI